MNNSSDSSILKELNLFDSICIIVGVIIGAGIYETASLIAANLTSPAMIIFMWLLGGLISLCGALCYAELASAYPVQGGDYFYLNRAYGSWAGYLFAWSKLVIIRPGSIAAMAFPFAHYLQTLWSPLGNSSWKNYEDILMAVSAILVLTFFNCLRVRTGKWVQNILTTLKALSLLFIFAVTFLAITPQPTTETSFSKGPGGISLALILILFTYGGWNEIAYVAAEVKEARKNILRSIILGMLLVTSLYLLVNLGFLHILGHSGMAASKAVAYDSVAAVWPGLGPGLISIMIIISTLGAANGLIFTGARISYALGREQRLFSFLARLNPETSTPRFALICQALLSIAIVLLTGSFDRTVVYTTAAVWIFFLATGISIFILRKKDSSTRRPYKVTWYPLTPVVFCLASAWLAYSAFNYDPQGSFISVCVLVAGFAFYRKLS